MKHEKDVKQLEKLIMDTLVTTPETRNCDELLYMKVCKSIVPDVGLLSAEYVLLNTKELGIPKIGTVGRYRRKIQQYHKELSAETYIAECRRKKEKEFENYSRKTLNV